MATKKSSGGDKRDVVQVKNPRTGHYVKIDRTGIFGFVKTRYKGLAKNAHRLFVTCALTNLYLTRRRLWRLSET